MLPLHPMVLPSSLVTAVGGVIVLRLVPGLAGQLVRASGSNHLSSVPDAVWQAHRSSPGPSRIVAAAERAAAVIGLSVIAASAARAAPRRAANRRRGKRCSSFRGVAPSLRVGSPVSLQVGASFDVEAWRAGFCDAPEIADGFYVVDGAENVPADLRGTFYRVGPGRFSVEGQTIGHQLDGDGLVVGMTFDGSGKVIVRQRLVQTQGFLRDQIGKRFVADGFHGSQKSDPGNFLAGLKNYGIKNTANAGALFYGEKLMAIGPCGKPYMIDTGSLGTLLGNEDSGESDLGGMLEGDVGFSPTPRVCATTGSLLNFSQSPSAMSTTVELMEFSQGGWKPRYRFPKSMSVGGYTTFSDMAVTPRFFVLARPPLKADTMAAVQGKPMADVLEYDPSGVGDIIFATRDRGGGNPARSGGKEVTIPVDNLVCTEFANAYDLEDRSVAIDMVAADRWVGTGRVSDQPKWKVEDPGQTPRTKLVRYELDPNTKAWTSRTICEDLHVGSTSVNPRVVGKKHQFVFCAVSHSPGVPGPMAGVAKVDVESGEFDSWVPGPTEFGGAPLFIPRAEAGEDVAEDDGYLINVVLDGAASRSDVLIFDAKSISKGPICRFPLEGGMLPHGLRGCWAEGVTFDEEEMKRKFVLLRMFKKKSKSWNAMDSSFNTIGANAFFQKQGTAMR